MRRGYLLQLSERELCDLLAALTALSRLLGDAPDGDGFDKLVEKLHRAYYGAAEETAT